MLVTAWYLQKNKGHIKEVKENLLEIGGLLTGYRDLKDTIIAFSKCSPPLLFVAGGDDVCARPIEAVL